MPTSIFDSLPDLKAYQADLKHRQKRYQRNRQYYDGSIYDRYRSSLAALQSSQVQLYVGARQLYEGTRLIFSPLPRCVRVDVAKVPGAWDLQLEASEATKNRVKALREQYDLERVYGRLLTFAGVAGEGALLVAGNRQQPIVNAYRPDEAVRGTIGGQPFGLIVKQAADASGKYEYGQLWTPGEVRTYRDGNQQGGVQRNPWAPVVPLFMGPFEEGEDGNGVPSFGGVLELLDRVNELASLTLDVISRNAEPLIVATGVSSIERAAGDDTLIIPQSDANVYSIDPKLAIADTLAFIQDVRGEYKNQLPQLHLDRLTGASDLAYETVLTLLMELGDHIIAVRNNVDPLIESVERLLLGDAPADYRLHRERAWMPLTESQQLDLEAKRQSVEKAKREAQQPQQPKQPEEQAV